MSVYTSHIGFKFRYCSPDDRAAQYIQVYTQTEEILAGEVV